MLICHLPCHVKVQGGRHRVGQTTGIEVGLMKRDGNSYLMLTKDILLKGRIQSVLIKTSIDQCFYSYLHNLEDDLEGHLLSSSNRGITLNAKFL